MQMRAAMIDRPLQHTAAGQWPPLDPSMGGWILLNSEVFNNKLMFTGILRFGTVLRHGGRVTS